MLSQCLSMYCLSLANSISLYWLSLTMLFRAYGSTPIIGKCFTTNTTINMQQKLELFENFISAHFHSFLTGSLFLRLSNSENLNYKIFVHDPDFFLANL